MAPSALLRGRLYIDSAAMEVVQSFLLHHVSEPKGGYENLPEALAERLRGLIADSVQRAYKAGADLDRI